MKDDSVYLAHILDCIARIEEYTQGGRREFMTRPMMQDAVMRNLEVIGEAVGKISVEFRRSHPEVAWRGAMALRNVLIHNYMGVNVGRVWSVVTSRLPTLKAGISALLAEKPGTDEPEA